MTEKRTNETAEGVRQANFIDLCKQCPTGCCVDARPPISAKRKLVIERYLKDNGTQIENVFQTKNSYRSPRETEGNTCCFLDKETQKCIVHEVKPETCVAGPITFDINSHTRKIKWYLKTEKICLLAGALFKNKSELQTHLESARRELMTLVKDLDAEALRAILKIDEPDTFKLGEDNLPPEVSRKLQASSSDI